MACLMVCVYELRGVSDNQCLSLFGMLRCISARVQFPAVKLVLCLITVDCVSETL